MSPEEFDRWYDGAFARVVQRVYAMCGDREEARDCVQEAFIRAWDRRRDLDLQRSPDAWVYRTAYRLAVSRWRRLRLARRPPDRALAGEVHAPAPDENRVALVEALRRLPAAQREAIVLHHIADLPVDSVADVVGVPPGTIKARLSRGRAALATLLSEGAPHV